MSKKLKIIKYIQLGIWIATIIALIVLILIPKDEGLLDKLFIVFGLLFLVMPIVLSVVNLIIFQIAKPSVVDNMDKMPFIGLSTISLLSVIYFLSSINLKGKLFTLAIILLFIGLNILFIYKLNKKRKYQFNIQATYLGISFIAFVVFFLLLVYISYRYGVNWIDPYK